jgi:hypothetical protein
MPKVRVKPYERRAKTAGVSGFLKVHPHHRRVKATRRTGVSEANVDGHLAQA